MQPTSLTSSEIISQIQQLVPPGTPEPQDAERLQKLKLLTQLLIEEYEASGRLQEDPFNEAWTRSLYLYEAEVRCLLQDRTVLVTGGEGFVGTRLVDKLVELGVGRIVSVDNARCSSSTATLQPVTGQAATVALYAADVRDIEAVRQIFAIEKPAIVFHLAAIRIPGLAEKIILETTTSNIFGTQNIIQLCEEFNVEQCVFSSTGKSSRYWTTEVYSATKKINEWLFAQAAQTGHVKYSMVRFTHMLNNSSMCEQIDDKIQSDRPINIHAPERYVVGQNVGEAVHLLLNSLIFSEPNRLKFILVRNLGWPTESLEVALYKIKQSGKNLPIYFQGIPPGYEEPFFMGQVDWDKQTDINTLINALETEHSATVSTSNDMIVSEVVPFSTEILNQHVSQLKLLCADSTIPQTEIKQKLGEAVREVSKTAFLNASAARGLQILKWGINLKQYQRGDLHLASYRPYIELIVETLANRLDLTVLNACNTSVSEFEQLLSVLETLPLIQADVAQIREQTLKVSDKKKYHVNKVA